MRAFDPIAQVKRYHDALNGFVAEQVEPMFAEEATYRSPSVGLLEGRDAIIAAMSGYFAEFPDQVAQDQRVDEIDPLAVRCEWQLRATSASTGGSSIRRGIEIIRFGTDGRILSIEVEDR